MSPTACLLATGHESGGLDGIAFFGEICLVLCGALALLVIALVVFGAVRRKKRPAPPSGPPTPRDVDDDRR